MKELALFVLGFAACANAAVAQTLYQTPDGAMSGGVSGGAVAGMSAQADDGLGAWRRAFAEPTEPGLESARLLPGWELANGNRMVALELRLQPGWKTYWRSPGDTGVPPTFDWSGSENLGHVTIHWPRPERIESGGEITLGYHELLVLPIEVSPARADAPMTLRGTVDFGLCLDICVPGHAELVADGAAGGPDPRIQAALDRVPAQSDLPLICRIDKIPDGMRVSAMIPVQGQTTETGPDMAVAIELDSANVWVSQPDTHWKNGQLTAVSELIDETGKPFALDPDRLRVTLISGDAAQEISGCDSLDADAG